MSNKLFLVFYSFISISYTNFINNDKDIMNQCLVRNKSFTHFNHNEMNSAETLNIGVLHLSNLEKDTEKRFTFSTNVSSPIFISVSPKLHEFSPKFYFNQIVNLTNQLLKSESNDVFFPCASRGQYDLILKSKIETPIRIQVFDNHPFANWTFLNRNPMKIRLLNRIQKNQMIVKWSKSQLDIHAIHYCVVINLNSSYNNFCHVARDYFGFSPNIRNCLNFYYANLLSIQKEKITKFGSNVVGISCTGSKTQQIIKGLIPNVKYYIDVFGVHTKLRNLTFLLKSVTTWFNRTHPHHLIDDTMTIGRISTVTSASAFSYKVINSGFLSDLNILILPCFGSQVDVKISKQRQKVQLIRNIYRPTYITQSSVQLGDRYIIRIIPSTEDEIIKANKVAIAVTFKDKFEKYPRLPHNTKLFEIRSIRNCRSTTIAWYSTPETRKFRYCVIVFFLPHSNRSLDYHTNYCMDFGRKITNHSNFYRMRCFEPNYGLKIQQFPLLNLSAGESYLIYVTANLLGGEFLSYESLKININKNCHATNEEFQWRNSSF